MQTQSQNNVLTSANLVTTPSIKQPTLEFAPSHVPCHDGLTISPKDANYNALQTLMELTGLIQSIHLTFMAPVKSNVLWTNLPETLIIYVFLTVGLDIGDKLWVENVWLIPNFVLKVIMVTIKQTCVFFPRHVLLSVAFSMLRTMEQNSASRFVLHSQLYLWIGLTWQKDYA